MRVSNRSRSAAALIACVASGLAVQAAVAADPVGELGNVLIRLAGNGPRAIAVGPDGNLWVGEGDDAIARIAPSGELLETYWAGTDGIAATVDDITPGPDGGMWFVQGTSNTIGRHALPSHRV